MKNVRIAFELYGGNVEKLPLGYQEVSCQIIFNVKMGDNSSQKYRIIAGGHNTTTPSPLNYSSVLSQDSVIIALTMSALSDLNVLACDIHNSYFTAK